MGTSQKSTKNIGAGVVCLQLCNDNHLTAVTDCSNIVRNRKLSSFAFRRRSRPLNLFDHANCMSSKEEQSTLKSLGSNYFSLARIDNNSTTYQTTICDRLQISSEGKHDSIYYRRNERKVISSSILMMIYKMMSLVLILISTNAYLSVNMKCLHHARIHVPIGHNNNKLKLYIFKRSGELSKSAFETLSNRMQQKTAWYFRESEENHGLILKPYVPWWISRQKDVSIRFPIEVLRQEAKYRNIEFSPHNTSEELVKLINDEKKRYDLSDNNFSKAAFKSEKREVPKCYPEYYAFGQTSWSEDTKFEGSIV